MLPIKIQVKNNYGFTLIELMVVVAIIAILSGIVMVMLSQAKSSAYNARRISDIKEVQKALELYSLDHNNTYPQTGSYEGHPEAGFFKWVNDCYPAPPAVSAWKSFLTTPISPYLSKPPSDPTINDCASSHYYAYKSSGTDYKIMIANPNNPNNPPSKNLIDPARDGGADPCVVDGSGVYGWAIYSSGAACWQ